MKSSWISIFISNSSKQKWQVTLCSILTVNGYDFQWEDTINNKCKYHFSFFNFNKKILELEQTIFGISANVDWNILKYVIRYL